ncbi:hypothetical protein SK128_015857 [Halocaridina rubra]|uniref:RFX-type winged-helix domain-containing protein n=1 Tax=Halocaridina rubra TaxID=373956 RepID=A0AAN9AGH2_HALRR
MVVQLANMVYPGPAAIAELHSPSPSQQEPVVWSFEDCCCSDTESVVPQPNQDVYQPEQEVYQHKKLTRKHNDTKAKKTEKRSENSQNRTEIDESAKEGRERKERDQCQETKKRKRSCDRKGEDENGKRSHDRKKDSENDRKSKSKIMASVGRNQSSEEFLYHHERENTSEGAATLTILADGNDNQTHNEFKKNYPNTTVSSDEGNVIIVSYSLDNLKSAGNFESEGLVVDDEDRDGELIIHEQDDNGTVYDDLVDSISEESMARAEEENQEGYNLSQRTKGRVLSKQKMNEGKIWLSKTLMVVAGTLNAMRLSDIEEAYITYCRENNKDPLATPVLARLIHGLFPNAEKCRLGPRGNQRIHYRNLSFKPDPKNKSEREEVPQYEKEVLKGYQNDKQNTELDHQSGIKEFTKQPAYQQADANVSEHVDKEVMILDHSDDPPMNQKSPMIPDQNDEEACKASARKLHDVLKWITRQGEGHKNALLRDFAHSASCQDANCLPVCLMFRRVRRHVVSAQHACSVLRLYSLLLRHHVSSCTSMKCGLPACPALRATRMQNHPKQHAFGKGRQVYRPNSLTISPLSPGGSLPESPASSPPSSPEASPPQSLSGWTLGPSQLQYVLVPVVPVMNKNKT